MVDNYDTCQPAVYRNRHLCMETQKPMWFWSGSTVKESEISDIAAYNKANGIMWIGFSVMMWVSTVLGALNSKIGGIILITGCIIGVPILPIVYGKIYHKYRK